jgi:HJR/Mrr/RecB family endonuclease
MASDGSRDEWIEKVSEAIEAAAGNIDLDEVRGVACVDGEECEDEWEVRQVLERIGEDEWNDIAPDDSDSPVEDLVDDAIFTWDVETFFDASKPQKDETRLGSSADLVLPAGSSILKVDLESVNEQLARYLAKHPEKLYDLRHRKFEELIAELFKDMGYEVELGPGTKDGGVDVRAISKSAVGTALTLIQCKKNHPSNPVGVEVVTRLYGTLAIENATSGLVVTTSFFTAGAKAERDRVPYRLGLADYDRVVEFLSQYPRRKA